MLAKCAALEARSTIATCRAGPKWVCACVCSLHLCPRCQERHRMMALLISKTQIMVIVEQELQSYQLWL